MGVYYPFGAVRVGDWLVEDYKFMLLDETFIWDPDVQTFVGDIISFEIGVLGYARQVVTGKALLDNGTWSAYDATSPSFIGMDPGANVLYMATYREVTNDGDSPVLWVSDFPAVFDSADISVVPISPDGLARVTT